MKKFVLFSLLFSILWGASVFGQTPDPDFNMQTYDPRVKECGAGEIDISAKYKLQHGKLKCEDKEGAERDMCESQARKNAAQEVEAKELKASHNRVAEQKDELSDKTLNKAIEKYIEKEKEHQKKKKSNSDVMKDLWKNLDVTKFSIKDGVLTLSSKEIGAAGKMYFTLNNTAPKEGKIEGKMDKVREAMKAITEETKSLESYAKQKSTEYSNLTEKERKEPDGEALFKSQEKARAYKKAWEVVQGVLQRGLNQVTKRMSEQESDCVREAEKDLSEKVLENIGKKTKSFNLTYRLNVGNENNLTLLDTNKQDGSVSLLNKVVRLMVQIAGTLAILLLIIGAVMMIVSRGSDALLTRGKNIVVYTLGGILVIFISYILVQFILSFLFVIG